MSASPDPQDAATDRGLRSWLSDRAGRLVVTGLVGVLAAAVAGAVALSGESVYETRTVLSIDQPVALATATDGGLLDKLSRLRIKYADLVPTPEIAGPAADELDLPVGRVVGSVSAEVPQLSLTLAINARSGDRAEAVDIANATAEALVEYVDDELDDAGVTEEQRYEFEILTPAVGAAEIEPTLDSGLRAAVSVGLLALAISYVGFAVYDATSTRRSQPD